MQHISVSVQEVPHCWGSLKPLHQISPVWTQKIFVALVPKKHLLEQDHLLHQTPSQWDKNSSKLCGLVQLPTSFVKAGAPCFLSTALTACSDPYPSQKKNSTLKEDHSPHNLGSPFSSSETLQRTFTKSYTSTLEVSWDGPSKQTVISPTRYLFPVTSFLL